MRTKFIMHSGARTIGGVICSITYGYDRVIFEMGSVYDPDNDIFDGKVTPRPGAWVRDAIRSKKAPCIDGLYRRQDLGGFMGLIPAEESPFNTAVFITHLHLDHMSAIGMVAPQIPVYMHPNAILIERALETTGDGVQSLERSYFPLIENVPISVGAIGVLPIITSRRSYCDLAFLITTPDGTFHWTGDLVLHGEDAPLAFEQMELLKSEGVDVLLCDCTGFMDPVLLQTAGSTDPKAIIPSREVPAGMLDRKDLDGNILAELEQQNGLCVINFYQREVDDARKYMGWAQKLERVPVFEPDCAWLIHKFFQMTPSIYLPDSDRYLQNSAIQPAWLKELLAVCPIIKREAIVSNPRGYLLQNSYRHILELYDLPSEGGAYFHLDGMPHGEFDPSYRNLLRIVQSTGFYYRTYFRRNYFGHAYPQQVKYFVDQVDPKVLIPCHSFNPELLLPNHGIQLLPIEGISYLLKDGNLIPEESVTN
jgi:ribonuclease J